MTQIEEGIALHTANAGDRIALRGVKFSTRVAGISARTTIEQTFVNLEDRAIEAVYTFPLPDGAAVCGFEVVFFDKVFTGVVQEIDKAIEKYDEAIAGGHGAYMVEQNRPDVFSARVGNLKPRQAVTIRLSYVMDLEIVDRSVRLSFPTTIAPRYKGAAGMDPVDAMIDGEALNPPHVLSVPYGLTLEAVVDLGRNLAGIESPSHAIRAEKVRGTQWKVELEGGMTEMDRDVVLELRLAKEQEPFAIAATSPAGEEFLAVSFVPEFDADDPGRADVETVFVLDCSGSMSGASIQQATAALGCCLRAMNAGDRFNICRFGSTYQMLWPEPAAYSEKTLGEALAFISADADLGGTEILAPLEEIVGRSPARSGVRNIVLLTDGQVSNEPAVIALARRKRSRNRFFTFGIGAASSQFLLKGLARVTGGAAEFIAYGERIEEKVLRAFGRMTSPPVTDVEIVFNKTDAQVAPREIPPVFDGDAVRLMARTPGRATGQVTLHCKTAAGPRSWTVNVQRAEDAAGVLPVLWARAMIRSIEDEDPAGAASSASSKPQAVEISKKYNVLCAQTSFIAIEHRSVEDRNEGKPELRRVPVMLAQGWGEMEAAAGAAAGSGLVYCMAMPPACPSPARFSTDIAGKDFDTDVLASELLRLDSPSPLAGIRKSAQPLAGGQPCTIDGPLPPAGIPKSAQAPGDESCRRARALGQSGGADLLIDLLSIQAADGAFDADWLQDWLGSGSDLTMVTWCIEHWAPIASADERIRRTLLVLTVLEMRFADRRRTWKRAAAKARKFLAGALPVPEAKIEAEVQAWAAQANRQKSGG